MHIQIPRGAWTTRGGAGGRAHLGTTDLSHFTYLAMILGLFQKPILGNPLIICDPDQEDMVALKSAKSVITYLLLVKTGGSRSCRI